MTQEDPFKGVHPKTAEETFGPLEDYAPGSCVPGAYRSFVIIDELADGSDPQVLRPDHYARFKIEPITFIMENDLPFHAGNIIKYVCRAGHKLYDGLDARASEIRDLEKVRRYAEMRINQLNEEDTL